MSRIVRRAARARLGLTLVATLALSSQNGPARAQPAHGGDCPVGYRWDGTTTRNVVGKEIVIRKNCIWAGQAKLQARVAARNADAAACIFDGRKLDCGPPVEMVTIAQSPLPVPVDAADFIKGIDPRYAANPTVRREIELYAHMAGVRGRAHDTLVADSAAYNSRPSDDARHRIEQDKAQVRFAQADEGAIKTRIGDMIGDLVQGRSPNYKPEPVVPLSSRTP
ncbi:MAG: hypothetical protein ACREEB_09720 [Caulobacteraceae bacterium]